MGVLNITPDSFSDGGLDPAAAIDRAQALCAEGADIIDVGAESTRPGASRIDETEQLRRLQPLFARAHALPALLSIDTTRSAVAQAAIDHGFHIVNDISAGRDDPDMFPTTARANAAIILMHMQGEPATMQISPTYDDVVREVSSFLDQRRDAALAAGIHKANVMMDPGIGFGKSAVHNLQLLKNLRQLASSDSPLVVGASRKGFIGTITGETDPSQRLFGTAAAVAWSVANHAAIVRVHDVAAMSRVVRMINAILLEQMPEISKV